ncbi:MAG: hypothetical protein WC459_02515 [Patescibacteria group bacterium]
MSERKDRLKQVLDKIGVLKDIRILIEQLTFEAAKGYLAPASLFTGVIDSNELINDIVNINEEFFTLDELSEIGDDDKKLGAIAFMKLVKFLSAASSIVEFFVAAKIKIYCDGLGIKSYSGK